MPSDFLFRFSGGCGGWHRGQFTFVSPFYGQCGPLASQCDGGESSNKLITLSFGLCILSLTFMRLWKWKFKLSSFGKLFQGKSLLSIPHLSRVQPSFRFWPDNFFLSFEKVYKTYLTLLLAGWLVLILTLPYYRRWVSAPRIFPEPFMIQHWERLLQCEGCGVSKTYFIHQFGALVCW